MRTGDVLTPPALEPLPIYEAREEEGALARPPRSAAARRGGRPRARGPRPRGGGPRRHRRRARPSTASSSTTSTSPTSTSGSERVPYEWLALLRRDAPLHWQPERDGHGFWVVHALRRRRPGVEGLGDVLVRARAARRSQDLTPEELEARKSMIDTDPPAHTRLRALVNKGFTPRVVNALRGADPRACARHPRAGVRAGRVRLGRVGRGGDPDVGLLRDHGPARRGPAADHRARRQDPRQHRPRGRRRGERRSSARAQAIPSSASCRSRARSRST